MDRYLSHKPEDIASCAVMSLRNVSERLRKPLSEIRVTSFSTARFWGLQTGEVCRFAQEVIKGDTDEAGIAQRVGLTVEAHEKSGDLIFRATV